MFDLLRAAGKPAELVEYRGIGHDPADAIISKEPVDDYLGGIGDGLAGLRVSDVMDYHAAGRMILPAEALAIHEGMITERLDEYGEVQRGRVARGAMIRAVDYIQAQRRRTESTR